MASVVSERSPRQSPSTKAWETLPQEVGRPILVKIVAVDHEEEVGSEAASRPAEPSQAAASDRGIFGSASGSQNRQPSSQTGPLTIAPSRGSADACSPSAGRAHDEGAGRRSVRPVLGQAVESEGSRQAPEQRGVDVLRVAPDGASYAVIFRSTGSSSSSASSTTQLEVYRILKAYSEFLFLYAKLCGSAEAARAKAVQAVLHTFPTGCGSTPTAAVAERLESWLRAVVAIECGSVLAEVRKFLEFVDVSAASSSNDVEVGEDRSSRPTDERRSKDHTDEPTSRPTSQPTDAFAMITAERRSKAASAVRGAIRVGTVAGAGFMGGLHFGLEAAAATEVLAETTKGPWNAIFPKRTVDLLVSPLALEKSCWRHAGVFGQGPATYFLIEVTARGERWTIARSYTDFTKFKQTVRHRLHHEESGKFEIPAEARKNWPQAREWSAANDTTSQRQAKVSACLNHLIPHPLGQTILAGEILAFMKQSPEDTARFGPAECVHAEPHATLE